MTKLILGSLLAAAAVGCTSSSDVGHITATWSFHDIALTGNSVVESPTGCPAGFDTVALHTVASDGVNIASCTTAGGDCYIDLFTCSDMAGTSAPLPAQGYVTWIEVTDNSGATTYATSASAFVDITNVDLTFSADILNNGGYFRLSWSLVGETSGAPLSCSQTAAASSAGGSVETTATINGTSLAASDKFNCEDHFGYSAGLPSDTYTISVDALNSSDQALSSQSTVLTNKVIGATPNDINDLGHVMIPIMGM